MVSARPFTFSLIESVSLTEPQIKGTKQENRNLSPESRPGLKGCFT